MTIKDAAKALDIKEYVLRYWEEELELDISRNEMGYRDYGARDMEMFSRIKELRKQGVGLKEIHTGICAARKREPFSAGDSAPAYPNQSYSQCHGCTVSPHTADSGSPAELHNEIRPDTCLPDEIKVVDFKTAQLQSIMNKIVANALKENKHLITSSLRGELTEDVMKQIDIILKEQEERDEARFRKLDETIRQLQIARSEAAATRNRKFFKP